MSHSAVKNILILVVFFTGSSGFSQTLVKFSDLPLLVEQNASDVKEQRLVEKTTAPVASLATSFLPVFELGTSHVQEGDASKAPIGSITTSINLYRGGKDALNGRIDESEVTLAGFETRKALNSAIMRSYQLYCQLVSLNNHVDILKTLESNLKSSRDIVRRRQARGQSPESDGLKIELEMLKLHSEVSNIGRDLTAVRLELGRLIGIQDFTVETDFAILEKDLQDIEKIQIDQMPAMASLMEQGQLLTHKRRLYDGSWLPDIDVFAAREQDFTSGRYVQPMNRTEIGLRFTIDLETKIRSRQELGRVAAEQELVELRKKTLAQKHADALSLLKADIASFQEKSANAKASLELAKKLASAIIKEFQGGVKDIEDVVAAQWGYYEASHAAIDVQESYANRLAEIMALIP